MNAHKLLAFYTLVCLFKAKEKPTERQNRRWVDFKQSKSERERLPCPRYAFGYTDKGACQHNEHSGNGNNDQRNNCRAPMRPREAPAVYVPFAETEYNKENETNNGN